jgi:osmotically-inducible protein OsmY
MSNEMIAFETDVDTYAAVVAALERMPMIRPALPQIHVVVRHGAAAVSGNVLSQIMRRAVIYTVASTPGINKVLDQLVDDTQIDRAVARALSAEPSLTQHTGIIVSTYLGFVKLTGARLSEVEQQKARDIAERVSGVQGVVIQLD